MKFVKNYFLKKRIGTSSRYLIPKRSYTNISHNFFPWKLNYTCHLIARKMLTGGTPQVHKDHNYAKKNSEMITRTMPMKAKIISYTRHICRVPQADPTP